MGVILEIYTENVTDFCHEGFGASGFVTGTVIPVDGGYLVK